MKAYQLEEKPFINYAFHNYDFIKTSHSRPLI